MNKSTALAPLLSAVLLLSTAALPAAAETTSASAEQVGWAKLLLATLTKINALTGEARAKGGEVDAAKVKELCAKTNCDTPEVQKAFQSLQTALIAENVKDVEREAAEFKISVEDYVAPGQKAIWDVFQRKVEETLARESELSVERYFIASLKYSDRFAVQADESASDPDVMDRVGKAVKTLHFAAAKKAGLTNVKN